MRKQNSKQRIIQQNHQILNNIKNADADKRKDALRKEGHILFADAKSQGFRKVGYDVFQRKEDIDAGNIWAVETIEGDDWLVCYTDQNDHILRNLKTAAKTYRTPKTAAVKEAVVMYPGDLVEITPRHRESIHNMYKGKKGEVTAAMPDRTQLSFDDGGSLWVENTDLTVIKDRRELSVGDNVRMFSRKNCNGKVLKFSYDKQYVTFENNSGQVFTARFNDIGKITKTGLMVQNIFTDPSNPDESKLLREYMKNQVQQQQQTPSNFEMSEKQDDMDMAMPQKAEMNEFPPSIKANPSQSEMAAGTALPAKQFANTAYTGIIKRGRQLNIGDQVQKKSTGEQGTIVDISFDKKLGKFYMINFGSMEPALIYDTDIMKMKSGQDVTIPPAVSLPTDTVPVRSSEIGKSMKKAVLGPQFNGVKEAALEFVEGMVAQALKNHEVSSPGTMAGADLEDMLVKQAITSYMAKYLPIKFRQALSFEDKNELSQWIFTTATDSDPDSDPDLETEAPTAENFGPSEPKTDIWNLQQNYRNTQETTKDVAGEKLSKELNSHIKFTVVKPTKLGTLRNTQKFVRDAIRTMVAKGGIPVDASHLIAQHVVSFEDINWNVLRRGLSSMGYKNPNQILETAGDIFAFTSFETAEGKKYALDLPGMETLRGGGGGYPGGMDVDPMGWQVKNPGSGEPDQNQLQDALQENLADQSVPFEQAAPKINIELDPESKKITIDYDQEEKPPIELEGAELDPNSPENAGQPNVGIPGVQPGQTGGQEQSPDSAEDFGGMDVPTNF
ncbi:MAG: hypothetical protein U9R15_10575 [Chloroflexota bacterium]|nr:hypothetical protein [Chloroflexota bacterium]